jgi:hypothetical protein
MARVRKRKDDSGQAEYRVQYLKDDGTTDTKVFPKWMDAQAFAQTKDDVPLHWVAWIEAKSSLLAQIAAAFVLVLLTIGAVALLVLAGVIFWNIVDLARNNPHDLSFGVATAAVINEVLLIFIVAELVETAYYQVKEGLGRALNWKLVEKLLIIALLSSIRHLLSVGAELSTDPNHLGHGDEFLRVLAGLGIIAGVVLVLVAGLIAFGNLFPRDDKKGGGAPRVS